MRHKRAVFQHPALTFAFEGSDAIICSAAAEEVGTRGAHSRRQDLKTSVEQALMRGLVIA